MKSFDLGSLSLTMNDNAGI